MALDQPAPPLPTQSAPSARPPGLVPRGCTCPVAGPCQLLLQQPQITVRWRGYQRPTKIQKVDSAPAFCEPEDCIAQLLMLYLCLKQRQ